MAESISTPLAQAVPSEFASARCAALMRRYALGHVLTAAHKKELDSVLPVGKPMAKRATSETYRFKLAYYAKFFKLAGKDPERKLKRWIAKGREVSPADMPPFDSPGLMADWWRRHMEWRVPLYLLRHEQPDAAIDPPGAPPTTPAPSPASMGDPTGDPVVLDMSMDIATDMGLQQIRALVVATFQQLQRCMASGHLAQANNFRREWQSLVGTLRQWEKDIVKIQEGKGEVMRTRVINTELVRIFGVLRQSFTNELLDLAEQLAPEMPPPERREIVLRRRDKCFVHLKSTRFVSSYQPTNE